ncbi:MAG: rhomboid family intramembrane serine protease [Kurthia gibsonii]|uniref:rhomboid family intramembrane serine protease n=1 Tax=Kurthia TaxID=1649 RepID=UPI000745D4A1|nr:MULTISPECIES: rhomboid family intramembrane serine protease [Kurthia]AMA61802.1 rhomboid family protein [Kurthia sp. 11kri321]MCA9723842.1 rhomboid family intramembrane serine protease [Kurthia sp.]RXH52098.1 rhomboid family intramembrane serine protease [Kurthia gibsonii]WIL38284.1 rhomboid family intramembrane serine protease [Kurthia sp. YJT4]
MFNRTENLSLYIKKYPVISVLIGMNLVVYLLGLIPGIGNNLYALGIAYNYSISQGEYWRLITAMFLHGGFLHLLFNMFGLYVFGPELEQLAGKLRFFSIYFISGLLANVATYVVEPLNYASLGASGAIFGIFGAYLALVYHTRKILPQLKQLIIPLVAISVIMTFVQSNINITAHLVGLAVGFILGMFQFTPKRIRRFREK